MKKLLFSTAIAVAMGVSNLAWAMVDLDNSDASTNGSLTYASEIAVDATNGTTLTDADPKQNFTAKLGFSVNQGAVRFVRVDLGASATFTNAPAMTVSGSTGTVSAGGAGSDFVIFEFTAGSDFGPSQAVNIDVKNVDVVSESDVSARYRLYETGTAAANEGTALADTSQIAYRFSPALVTTVKDADEETIDVATNSTKFVGDTAKGDADTTQLAQVEIKVNGTSLWNDDSLAATLGDLVTAATSLVVSGDFSAVPLDGNGNPDPAEVMLNGTPADSLTTTDATFTTAVGASAFTGTNAEATVDMNVSGDVEIPDVSFTAVYDVTAKTGADTADVSLGTVSTLEKNGSTQSANMVLAPLSEGGAFRNFIRISNNSGVAGRVFLRLRNDVGDSVSFNLGDVAGQSSTTLDANSATSLISNDQLFAAAQAADPSFELGTGGRNKLRLTVEGEFQQLQIDNINLSSDNTQFTTFQ